ncbi:MAG: GNAT family N-acetyltransferase [Clostridia bacterium]|nr:GNAT family N-acetyltransferase [Clostridia bacterium]
MFGIRKAKPDDADIITKICFKSKDLWKYPLEYFDVWKEELTISPNHIESKIVYVVETGDTIVAFYSIITVSSDFCIKGEIISKGYYLERMFVLPQYIMQGIGHLLMEQARKAM